MRPQADTYGQRRMRAMLADPTDKAPADVAAEKSIIADILDPDTGLEALDIVRAVLEPGDFTSGKLGAIFEAACAVRDGQSHPKPIGDIEIGAWLRSKELAAGTRGNGAHLTDEEAETIRDAVALRTTIEMSTSVRNTRVRVDDRAFKLRRLAEHRRLITKLFNAGTTGFSADPELFRAVAMDLASDITETLAQVTQCVSIGDALSEAISDMLRVDSAPVDLVNTGIDQLDDMFYLTPGSLVVVGARSGVGKSSLSMQIGTHVGDHWGPVLYFSTEMKAKDLALRVACSRACIDLKKAVRKQLDPVEKTGLAKAADEVRRCQTHIADNAKMYLPDILRLAREHARTMRARGKPLRLIIVDYLQRVDPSPSATGRTREQDVAFMAKAFKDLAMELDCCVIVPCQLNKEGDKRTDARPRASDARESSGIENEADVFLLIHNPEYAEREKRPHTGARLAPEGCDIIVGKNRNGPKGVANVWFHPNFTTFVQMSQLEIEKRSK